MKKVVSVLLAAMCAMSLMACGKSVGAEVYTGESDFVEAGYEGDCINTNQDVLVLNSDGTYTLQHNFFVNQISGVIVASTKNVYNGKYTATDADADGNKTVKLEVPTSGLSVMNGTATSSSEDPEILADFNATEFTVNVNLGTIVVE